MGGNAGGGMNGGPRPLFPQGSPGNATGIGAASAAGIGSANQSRQSAPGMGMFGQMAPAIFQGMQQGNMNPVFAAAIGRALSGGFSGGPQQMNSGSGQPIRNAGMSTQPAALPGGMPGQGMSGEIGLLGESRNMSGAPMQFVLAEPNPLMNRGGGGFASPGVPFIGRQPVNIPPGMQNPQPLFPTNPGSGAPQPRPAVPGQPAPGNPAAGGMQNMGRIAALQQMIQNPDQSSPIALLRARRELAQLTGS